MLRRSKTRLLGNRGKLTQSRTNTSSSERTERPEYKGKGSQVQQNHDKYKLLAQEALSSGDRITAEFYFQHADHFLRLLNDRWQEETNRHSRGSEGQPSPASIEQELEQQLES